MGVASGLLGVGALAIGIHQGEEQKRMAKRSARQTEAFQAEARRKTASQERTSIANERRASQKKPDLMALLSAAQEQRLSGIGSTMLSRPGRGAASLLGQNTQLGR